MSWYEVATDEVAAAAAEVVLATVVSGVVLATVGTGVVLTGTTVVGAASSVVDVLEGSATEVEVELFLEL